MMMKMLGAGGLELVTDDLRAPDPDNPEGYFELQQVKGLMSGGDKRWLFQARGKAIKVISQLVPCLPREHYYGVVFMCRDLDEVIRSQDRMLATRGAEPAYDRSNRRLRSVLEEHITRIHDWLSSRMNFRMLEVRYSEAVCDPHGIAEAVRAFVGLDVDAARMASAVDPGLHRQRTHHIHPHEPR